MAGKKGSACVLRERIARLVGLGTYATTVCWYTQMTNKNDVSLCDEDICRPAGVTTKRKNRRRKRKKKGKKSPSHRFEHFEVRETKQKGRGCFAVKKIPPGTTILLESASVFALFSDFNDKEQNFWCPSEEHQSLIKEILIELPRISKDCNCDKEILELVIRFLFKEHVSQKQVKHSNDIIQTSYGLPVFKSEANDVLSLVSHIEGFTESWTSAVSSALKAVLPLLPDSLRKSKVNESVLLQHALCIAQRINHNAHAITQWKGVGENAVGAGLFPVGAMFNHSCKPNCHFFTLPPDSSQMAPVMVLRTTANVNIGDELSVSYIDLYQDVSMRRSELLATKYFKCTCDRCEEESASIETEQISTRDSFCCSCGIAGILKLGNRNENNDDDELWMKENNPPKKQNKQQQKKKHVIDKPTEYVESYNCRCGNSFSIKDVNTIIEMARSTQSELPKSGSAAIIAHEEWLRTYVAGGYKNILKIDASSKKTHRNIKPRKTSKFSKNKKENSTQKIWGILHPNSALAINTITSLANLYGKAMNHRQVSLCADVVVKAMTTLLPDGYIYPEAADYMQLQADALIKFMKEKTLPKRTAMEMRSEVKRILQSCLKIRECCLVDNHPAIQSIKKKLDDMRLM